MKNKNTDHVETMHLWIEKLLGTIQIGGLGASQKCYKKSELYSKLNVKTLQKTWDMRHAPISPINATSVSLNHVNR